MPRLVLPPDAPRFLKECAVETAAVVGFHSLSLEFPVLAVGVAPVAGTPLTGDTRKSGPLVTLGHDPGLGEAWLLRRDLESRELILRDGESRYEALEALSASLAPDGSAESPAERSGRHGRSGPPGVMDGGYDPLRPRRGLESLFARGFILRDYDYDFLPDRIDARIALPDDCDDHALSAACDLAARLGLESLGLSLPLLANGRPSADGSAPDGSASDDARGPALIRFEDAGVTRIGLRPGPRTEIVLEGRGPGLAALVSEACRLLPDGAGDAEWAEEATGGGGATLSPDAPRTYAIAAEGSLAFPWEVDELRALVERDFLPLVEPGRPTRLEVVVGEDTQTRADLEREFREALERAGAAGIDVQVTGAFKQGLTWIRDYELPRLEAAGGVASIEIGFTPFLPEGRTEWNDEDGATPRISADRVDAPEAWLDPPIRLLQELYPIDDIVASRLGIHSDAVRFEALEEGIRPVGSERAVPGYRLKAFDAEGRTIREASYDVSFAERAYLDEYPGIGRVHPGTGRVRLVVDGRLRREASLETDLERVWDAYQAEVLPACRRRAETVSGGRADAALQPFFTRLRLEIGASEPDEELGPRQDRLSSLESLHEDLYFAGLDYFQTLGLKATGRGIDAPGLILPVIRRRPGPPSFRYAIEVEEAREAPRRPAAWIEALRLAPGGGALVPTVRLDGEALELGPTRFDQAIRPEDREKPEERKNPATGAPVRFGLEETLIGPEEYRRLIGAYAGRPGLRVRRVATSRQGRDIHAIEVLPDLPGRVSRTKLVASRPVCYVNARHHANEVSGTNAAFMLADEFLAQEGPDRLADRVNVVIVPFENADGAAVHYELARDNPEWILHIARYNSLGKELAHEYWKDDTPHREAMAFTRVWRDWLPDVVVDDHGVPSHEWCQQFSGYTSPWFKGFWMPRALLYAYFWYVTDERYAPNKALAERLERAIAAEVGAAPECAGLNASWRERFEKYAHAWMPRLFPAEYRDGMIFYWVPFAYRPDYHYAAVRFPWITASSLVTEVSDETATGPYLGLCARTQLRADLAAVRALADADPRRRYAAERDEVSLRLRLWRERPALST